MRFLAFICAAFIGSIGAANAYVQDGLSVGAWTGGAYFDNQTRKFSHCAVGADYDGIDVVMLYSDSGFSVAFSDKSWNLKPGEQYDFQLTIDSRWSKRVTGSVPFDGTILVDLGTDQRAISAFRFGNALTLNARRGMFVFNLERTSAAIAAISDCYAAHTRPNESNPFADNPSNPFAARTNAEATDQGTGSPWRVSPPALTFEQFKQIMQTSLGSTAVAERVAKGSQGDYADYLVTDGSVVGAFWQEDSRTRQLHGRAATGLSGQRCLEHHVPRRL